ncbi:MAG: thiamine diphosphokinase [Coriobacteriia bacterium]|nr:thiamine diphosphokinase [Coriobacteriia bacterium]
MAARSALIVGACPSPFDRGFYHATIRSAEVLIAADGGLDLCLASGRTPDVCVGDFDSVTPQALATARRDGAEILTFPVEKDASDLDLAVTEARNRGLAPVTITAAFAGRPDHTFASLGVLLRAADLDARAAEPHFTAFVVDAIHLPALDLDLPVGATLSLFSADAGTTLCVSGVRYPLVDETLEVWTSRGLSNVVTEPHQRISVSTGRVLMFAPST